MASVSCVLDAKAPLLRRSCPTVARGATGYFFASLP